MKGLLTILVILTSLTSLTAQSRADSLILTKEQCDSWIIKVDKEIKSRQLYLIRQRILLDTNVYILYSYPDRIKVDTEKENGMRTEGYGKPLLVFNGQYIAEIYNKTKNNSIKELADFLTLRRIKNVSIVKDIQATAIYGSRAVCGVILLTTKDKKTLRQIKEIRLSAD